MASGQEQLAPAPLTAFVSDFRPAITTPEHTLNKFLRMAETDNDLFAYILNKPFRNLKLDSYYKGLGLFSGSLMKAWASAEAKRVSRDCGGRYIAGELCGLGFHPLTCTQDFPVEGYLFKTEQHNINKANISYIWPQEESAKQPPIATYRMIKKSGRWLLDGVYCHDLENAHFNSKNIFKKH